MPVVASHELYSVSFQSNGRILMLGCQNTEVGLIIQICRKFGKPNYSDWPAARRAKLEIVKLPDFKAPASAGKALTPKLDAAGQDLFNVSSFSLHPKIMSSGRTVSQAYPAITYCWTVPLFFDHSYLVEKLTKFKNF